METPEILQLLIARADEALYEAKRLGGNMVCSYGVDIPFVSSLSPPPVPAPQDAVPGASAGDEPCAEAPDGPEKEGPGGPGPRGPQTLQ
jgi:hypothetical protein